MAMRTRACAYAALAIAVSACEVRQTDVAPADLRIIDAHVHTDFTGEPEPASGIPETQQRFLEDLARAGVVGAVAHTDTAGGGYVDLSEHGVIHCAGVSSTPDTVRLADGLRSGRFRCLKIYLGYTYRFATDPVYGPVYRLAANLGVPVVFHTGDTYSSRGKLKYAHPLDVDEVAVDNPDVTFVIAHAGYPWFETAAEIAYKNPNVFIEASAFMVGSPSEVSSAWLERYVVQPIAWVFGYIEDPTKLMFASDWPLVDIAGYVDAYKRAIPQEHWQAVFHDNAARVFGLEPAGAASRTAEGSPNGNR